MTMRIAMMLTAAAMAGCGSSDDDVPPEPECLVQPGDLVQTPSCGDETQDCAGETWVRWVAMCEGERQDDPDRVRPECRGTSQVFCAGVESAECQRKECPAP